MNGNDIKVGDITIGKYNSMYNKYELLPQDLKHELCKIYDSHDMFLKPYKILNTPISDANKREQEFKHFRESLFPSLQFQYPEMNQSIYDCIINGCFKVQDKVASISHANRKTSNIYAHVSRKRFSKKDYQYKLGDNDFYWIHLPDKKGAYILPEMVLYNYGIICDKNEDRLAPVMFLNPRSDSLDIKYKTEYNKYLFMYDKDIDNIVSLFQSSKKESYLDILEKHIKTIVIVDRELKQNERVIVKKERVISQCTSCQKDINRDNKSQLCLSCYKQSFKVELKCTQCNIAISKDCVKGLCLTCQHLSYRTVERPSYEQLLKDVKELNYTNTGKKYGVSDNSIRKWIKNYEK
jgi:hypothetical protein